MKKPIAAFTLIELLLTITIIGTLITLGTPMVGRAMKKAESVRCAANLRTVGQAVHLYAQDHDNHYPIIEGFPSSPYYPSSGENAGTLLEVLGPYGISSNTLRCQADVKGPNYFAKEGSSYMWVPIADDELVSAPKVYRRGREYVPPPTRLRLLYDFTRVHQGHSNCLMGDGRVRMF